MNDFIIERASIDTQSFFDNISSLTPESFGEAETLVKQIYQSLNLSLISGEYILDSSFEKRIDDFSSIIDKEYRKLEDVEIKDDNQYEILKSIFQFVEISNSCLNHYKRFVRHIWKELKNPDKKYLLNTIKSSDSSIKDIDSFKLEEQSKLFFLSLDLSIIDMSLSLNENYLRELFLIRNKLNDRKIKTNPLASFLIEKCEYLIYKFKYKYDSNEELKSLLISFDFDELNFNPDSYSFVHLKDLQDKTKRFHPTSTDPKPHCYYSGDYKVENYSFADYYALSRYYKDVLESPDKIEELLNNFKKIEVKNDFDKISKNICLNYIFNCKISLMVSHCELEHRKILEIQKEIDILQKETLVKNFFPYYKICKHYNQKLHNLVEKSSINDEQLTDIVAINNSFKDSLKVTRSLIKWDTEHNFLPYQPLFHECCLTIKLPVIEEIKVFLLSSFVTPVDYQKYELEIEDMELNCRNFGSMVAIHKSISQEKNEILNVKKEIEKTKNEVDQAKKSNIEILSIFAAIVMFVSSNIQIFSRVSDLKSVVVFSLSFAYILSIFVILIWFVVNTHNIKYMKDGKPTKTQWIIIISMIIGLVINLAFLFIPTKFTLNPTVEDKDKTSIVQVNSPSSSTSLTINKDSISN